MSIRNSVFQMEMSGTSLRVAAASRKGQGQRRFLNGAKAQSLQIIAPSLAARQARSENTCAATANFLAFRSYIKNLFE